jgi:transposase-like protein
MVYTPSTLRCDTPLREVAMLWLETDPMNERLTCVQDALSDRFTMVEVCARYGVSRPTGYKGIARYAEQGRRGLGDRSRAPRSDAAPSHSPPDAAPRRDPRRGRCPERSLDR